MSWEMVKLADVCDFQGGTQPPKSEWSNEYKNGYVKMLQIRNFTQSEKKFDEYVKDKSTLKKCVEDDILIGRYGASVGKILTGLSGAYNVALVKSIPSEQLEKKYFYFYLTTDYFQNFIQNIGSRAAQAGFNKSDLKSLQIPLPPLSTQKRIAEILDKADALRKKDQQLLKYYDDLAQSLFIDLFGDPVKNEKGWEVKKLGSIIGFPKGLVDPRIAPYSDMYHIGGDNIVSKTGELINYKPANQLNLISGKYLFDNTQLLYNKIRPYLNKVAKPNFNGICSANMYPISPNLNFANRDYLWSIMTSNSFIKFSETVARRANIPKINREELCEYLLPVPPLELQNQFATQIQNIEQQKERLKIQIQASEHLFQALLKQAFNGGLAV